MPSSTWRERGRDAYAVSAGTGGVYWGTPAAHDASGGLAEAAKVCRVRAMSSKTPPRNLTTGRLPARTREGDLAGVPDVQTGGSLLLWG